MNIQKAESISAGIGITTISLIGGVAQFCLQSLLLKGTVENKVATLVSSLFSGIGYGILFHGLCNYQWNFEKDIHSQNNIEKRKRKEMEPTKKTVIVFISEVLIAEALIAFTPAFTIGLLGEEDSGFYGMAYGAGALVSSGFLLLLTKGVQGIARQILLKGASLEMDQSLIARESPEVAAQDESVKLEMVFVDDLMKKLPSEIDESPIEDVVFQDL